MKMFVLLSVFVLAAAEESQSLSLLQTAAHMQSHSFGKEECEAAKADQKSKKAALKAARKAAKDARAAAQIAKAAAKAAKAAAKAAKEAFDASKAAVTEACPTKIPKAGATPVPELPTGCRKGRGVSVGRQLTQSSSDFLMADETCASGTWLAARGVGAVHSLNKGSKKIKSPEACVDAALKDPTCIDGADKSPVACPGAADFVNFQVATGDCECGWAGTGPKQGGLPMFTCYTGAMFNSPPPNGFGQNYVCGFIGIGLNAAGTVVNGIR